MKTVKELQGQLTGLLDDGHCTVTLRITGEQPVRGVLVYSTPSTITLWEEAGGRGVFRSYPWHNIFFIEIDSQP
jgi:hypothetical protein